jgi:uncharacterized protein (TIGR01319 family)
LRIIAIGLVPDYTSEAATRAALGAGSNVVGTYSFEINPSEMSLIEAAQPDLILLAGGTDGGNKEVILNNSRLLSTSSLTCPIIIAGNKSAAAAVADILCKAGKVIRVTENVMPEFGKLNPLPARQVIREIFMEQIVEGKGIGKARRLIDNVLMPTPLAVSSAAVLLSEGSGSKKGWGDLMVADVGGATTDIHSVSLGRPTKPNVSVEGLEEPYLKRTVEGDLGVRINARSIIDRCGKERICQLCAANGLKLDTTELSEIVGAFADRTELLASSDREATIDLALAAGAIEIAAERHAGKIETVYIPGGEAFIQHGKDLSEITSIIGTGGPLVHCRRPDFLLAGLRADSQRPFILKPTNPSFFLDEQYIMYAVGLLSETDADAAFHLMMRYVKPMDALPRTALGRISP